MFSKITLRWKRFWLRWKERNMNVGQLMNRNVETCRLDDNLAVAAGKMWDRDVGCLPVLGRQGHVVGIVTDRDICMAGYMQGRPLTDIPVSVAMSRQLHACRAEDALIEAEEIMRTQQLRRLPVLGPHGGLVGLISLSDLAREAGRESGRRGRQLTAEEVSVTLAAVCEPRPSRALAEVFA
jgi:CBS domain-containing protein